MTISHVSTGTPQFWNTQVGSAITLPAHSSGDMILLLCGVKSSATTQVVTTGTGWTQLGNFADTFVAPGVDVGSMKSTIFYKTATSGAETSPVITNSASPSCFGCTPMVFGPGGEVWDTPVVDGGGDATAGTGFSVTAGADPGVTTGDMVVFNASFRSDAATPCSSHIAVTQTGITFTPTHDPATDGETTTGGDMGMCSTRATVSGTSSAAPVMAGTLAAAHTGSAIFVRLRTHAGGGGATHPGWQQPGGWWFRNEEWARDHRIPLLGDIPLLEAA